MSIEPVVIIGVGMQGRTSLEPTIQELIVHSDELWGSSRLLAEWEELPQPRVVLDKQLTATLCRLEKRSPDRKVVILASGDPGFYGIAATVLQVLPAEEIRIYPEVSSLQAAFAKVCIPWSEAALTSAHARPLAEIIGLARRFPKLGILTDPQQTPGMIAERLLAAGIADCRAIVLENLGQASEKMIDSRLSALPDRQFAPLNVLLLVHDPGWKPAPACQPRPDSAYQHKKGLITKSDVRLASILRLGICETDLIWDIGAGSGAVSIEMAEMAWRGQVFAIEKDAGCLDCLRQNLARFGTVNVEIVAGAAPQALHQLPAPGAVFIGGSSGKLVGILNHIQQAARPGCRVVANFAILENMMQAHAWMQSHGWQPALTEASFSYGSDLAGGTRLVPANPVFILSGTVCHKEGS
jgi:precorrin-6Y C5,15-methyltransferase (decarboxylating)